MSGKHVEKQEAVIARPIRVIGDWSKAHLSSIELPDYKMKLIEAVTRSRRKDEAIGILKGMHPGARELKLRTEIAKLYGEDNWEQDVERYTKAMGELRWEYGLRSPDSDEKLEAVRNEDNLSEAQKIALANRFKMGISNLEIAASIQLKLRKTDGKKLSLKMFDENERKILNVLLPGKSPLEEKASSEELERLKKELIEKFYVKIENRSGIYLERKVIYPAALALYNSGECGIETLRQAVREKKEAEILLEFMGREPQHKVEFVERGLTRRKNDVNEDALNRVNEDALLSADIHVNGKIKRLDAVFDGVGSSNKASSASSMAVEVFKLGLLLKPPKSTADLELLMGMADLAIFTCRAANVGLDASATTAAVFLLDGKNAAASHAGDSGWKVFRKNKAIYSSIDHSVAAELEKDGHPSEGPRSSVITSALGTSFNHLDSCILDLKKGDVYVLYTDGVGDTVKNEEMGKIFSEEDDVALSETRIFTLARSRNENDKKYPSLTGGIVYGKCDDDTVIAGRVE
ncbi:protein phosphatase 2C domain-containing protein [Candidatus Micrarchaeota archaeon]|nr:protein phosphatase 2C domain-containing protein [Candidatus Micrarchaeota archaeon]